MSAPWNRVLDEIEADLTSWETAFADRTPVVATAIGHGLSAAVDDGRPLGPLPEELALRAELLLARTRDLEARAVTDRDRIGASLRALRGHPAPEQAPTGRVVDVAG